MLEEEASAPGVCLLTALCLGLFRRDSPVAHPTPRPLSTLASPAEDSRTLPLLLYPTLSHPSTRIGLERSGPNLEPRTMRVYVTNGRRNGLSIGRKVGLCPGSWRRWVLGSVHACLKPFMPQTHTVPGFRLGPDLPNIPPTPYRAHFARLVIGLCSSFDSCYAHGLARVVTFDSSISLSLARSLSLSLLLSSLKTHNTDLGLTPSFIHVYTYIYIYIFILPPGLEMKIEMASGIDTHTHTCIIYI